MPFRSGQNFVATLEEEEEEKEEDWEIIAADWWRTSFKSLPLSYISKPDPTKKKWHRQRHRSSIFYNPHWKQNSTYSTRGEESSNKLQISDQDNTLNVELAGVRAALESVILYEEDVGFHFVSFPEIELNLSEPVDLGSIVDDKEHLAGREKWEELLEGLMNGRAFDSDESLESSFIDSISSSGLHRSTSTLSSIDLTFSEGSIDSNGMPSTPKPKTSFNHVEIKEPSPRGGVSGGLDYHLQSLSPTRALNAAASSFVPTFCPQLNDEPLQFPSLQDKPKLKSSPASSFANFTFPTLNSHTPPTVKIKKDDQGFFTEVHLDNSSAPPANLLPPFLQEASQRSRTRKSRTREIVDRLRSQLTPAENNSAQLQQLSTPVSVSEDGGDRPSSPSCEDDDGWINVSHSNIASLNKAKRARELLLALTRRRTDSLTSENIKELMMESSPDSSASQDISLSSSPCPSPPLVTPNDGWTESRAIPPPEPQKKAKQLSQPIPKESPHHHAHNRKKSSNHTSRASTSSTAQSHLHPHHHPQHHHSHQQQFSATSSCYPHPQHPSSATFTHMASPQAVPYFFPAYPAVTMPVPYTTYLQPHYHVGMSTHGHTTLVNPIMASGVQYAVPTALMPGVRLGTSAHVPSTAAANMSVHPSFRTPKHAPLW